MRHGSADKSPSSSSHVTSASLDAGKVGSAVAQACLSAARMTKVVEDNHNSKIVEALLVKQHLTKASAEVIDSMMEDICNAHTPADMWWVEKRISICISHHRAETYDKLVEQYRPNPESCQDKEGMEEASTDIAEAEEEFQKSMMDLISTVIMEGGKVPGGHRVALASNVLQLVPTLPLNPVLTTCIDLPPEKGCRVVSVEVPRPLPAGASTPNPLPSLPLTGTTSGSGLTKRSTIRFGQAMIQPITHVPPAIDYGFFKKPLPVEVPPPSMGWKSLAALSTPLPKPCIQTSWEDLNKRDPIDLTGSDEDNLFVPAKESSTKSKETHKGSK